MRDFFAGTIFLVAIAPWFYMLLAAPMAYFFFDLNLWAPVFQTMVATDRGALLIPVIVCSMLWTIFWGSLAASL